MLITTDPRHAIMIGLLVVGWLTLVASVNAQEATSNAEPLVAAPAVTTAPAATDTITNQIATAPVLTPAAGPQPTSSNISITGINSLQATTNAPPPDPRSGDAPGWWFEAAMKQRGDYPAFLGVRFAESSRAIIIETPNRKLKIGQPLVYRLWVCNDLPQPMEFRLEHAVRKNESFINQTNVTGFMVKGSEARLVDRFKQSTDWLAPGTYTIDATLRDQTGKLLHQTNETVELAVPQ